MSSVAEKQARLRELEAEEAKIRAEAEAGHQAEREEAAEARLDDDIARAQRRIANLKGNSTPPATFPSTAPTTTYVDSSDADDDDEN